jgi:arylsulfatase A-like enzyme
MASSRVALIVFIAAALGAGTPARGGEKPNVLLVLIDDLGAIDTGVTGSTFYETPNIDRLTAQGARFSHFYTAGSVCSPTRASLMTGKSPARLHITDWIGGNGTGKLVPPPYEHQLPLDEFTLGEAFAAGGYDTGYIGKWHLGAGSFLPSNQGFAFTRAVNAAGQPGAYFAPYQSQTRPETNVPQLEDAPPNEYLTDRLTREAVKFIEKPRSRPFFLVLAHYAVHTPLQAKADATAKYAARRDGLAASGGPETRAEGPGAMTKLRQDHPTYAAMVESMDASVGNLMKTLDTLKIADNTVVVFLSDNGGLSTLAGSADRAPTSNLPLRAGKGWLYEGGIRAPLIVRWPGRIRGGAVIETPAISNDLYPTLLELSGLPARPSQHKDGASLAPLLRGRGTLSRDALYWHFPHYHDSGGTPSGAIRKGSLKLIEWFEDGRAELYDLASDPGESRDLARERPADAAALRADLSRWRDGVGARMPMRGPGGS